MSDMHKIARTLHPLETKVLLAFSPGEELDAARLARDLGFKEGQANQAFSWLVAKGWARETRRVKRTVFEITALGRELSERGTPEERVVARLAEKGPATLPELREELGLEQKDVGSAFGKLSKDGILAMDADKRASLANPAAAAALAAPRTLMAKAIAAGGLLAEDSMTEAERALVGGMAKRRGAGDAAFRAADREDVYYALESVAAEAAEALRSLGVSGDELGAVTSEMLASGAWKGATFRPYNVKLAPQRLLPGRRNPYAEFLQDVKDRLVGLGFEEFDGGLVETEFWNSDALFMPQFHSARDIHDVYYVANPRHAKRIEEPWLSAVAATHENGGPTGSRGWGYRFDRDFTRRLILRSQGTVLSARQLTKASVPGKYFGIARCFRYDKVDATHLSDFHQTEGIVLGEDVNLRTLLGLLRIFAVEIAGAKEVKYVPGYFPFTEPSVEVHVKHPSLGWFELGGAGIFRPEVTEPLGVKVPVLAWGIGIDRMALMALGIDDIRELFSYDIEGVRLRRADVRGAEGKNA